MSIITGAVIVVGCSAVGFLVAILVVNLKSKPKKPIPVRASHRQVDLPDFQSIPQEAAGRLDAIYEKAFDALKEMDPKKPTKPLEKSGPVKQNQKTVNRQVLASMLGPSFNDPDQGLELREETRKLLLQKSTIEKSKLLTSEQMEEKLKKRSRRVVCQKCGHKWLVRGKDLPKHCPNCHRTTWRKP